MTNNARVALALAIPALFSACGGGGSGSNPAPAPPASTSPPVTLPVVLPTAIATASGAAVAGSVVQLPADAYGPATIGAAVYASADAAQTTPLAGATVIVGRVPVSGATPPATLPAGDVAVLTDTTGTFSAQPAVAPAPATSAAPFVVPHDNILGFAPPANGYYVEVYGATSDGRSAGSTIPLHRFVAASSSLALRVSTLSAAEAGALAAINHDRATAGAGPLVADAAAEEIARLHASDESNAAYTCHYDTHNIGPASRYLAIGGLGLTGEGLGLTYGPDAASAFAANEAAMLAEQSQTPTGGHYVNLIDPSHQWAGIAAIAEPSAAGFFNVDYELVTPNGVSATVGASGYPTTGVCPPGTTNNGS
jgi:uncharacterized protein YkwD